LRQSILQPNGEDGTRHYYGLTGWLIGFSILYVAAGLVLPIPVYFPVEHRWGFDGTSGELPMRYFGQLLSGIIGGVVGLGMGKLVARNLPIHSRELFYLLAGWSVLLLLLTLLIYGVRVFS